jgi:hypothetical protein
MEDRTRWNGNQSSLDRWLKGLKRMYGNDTLNEKHAIWFAIHAPFMVPCITAYYKVHTAYDALTDRKHKLTPEEMAEYQTCSHIVADSSQRVQQIMNVLNGYKQEISRATDVIIARQRLYRTMVAKKDPGDAPENKERRRQGLAPISKPRNLAGLGKRGREAIREAALQDQPAKRARVLEESVLVPEGEEARRGGSPEWTPQSPRLTTGDELPSLAPHRGTPMPGAAVSGTSATQGGLEGDAMDTLIE